METGYDYEEIDADLYLTPSGSSEEGGEVDPMVELEELEREEDEQLAMEREDTPAPSCGREKDGQTAASNASIVSDVVPAGASDASLAEVERSSSEHSYAASEDVASVSDSSEDATGTPPQAMDVDDEIETAAVDDPKVRTSADSEVDAVSATVHSIVGAAVAAVDDTDNDNDQEDGDSDVEFLWSGPAPPWARDARADAANALLVHACSCDARRCCRDPQFGKLCVPLQRLLRSACWASHNDDWLTGHVATHLAKLLGYHSLHCDARTTSNGACAVPLCAELARGGC